MDTERALDDIKLIRQVMQRTRQALGRESGWFSILWGCIWLIGFLGSQFLETEAYGWLWTVLNILGGALSAWLGIRMGRRQGNRTSSVGWRILGWWGALAIFVLALVWLLELYSRRELTLVIVLAVALGYVQMGLFSELRYVVVGVIVAVLVIVASVLLPNYMFLVMAFLGGGLLIVNGIQTLRAEE